MESEYIEAILHCAKKCTKMARQKRDPFHKATDKFFEIFSSALEENLHERSHGNRHIMSKPFERAIISSFKEIDGVIVGGSPRLEGTGDDFPKKYLDILVTGSRLPSANRSIVIEIKGTGFDPIAAALMSFAVASRKGENFSCSVDGERIVRKIQPMNTRFLIVNNAAFRHEKQHFDMCMNVVGDIIKNVGHHAFFPWGKITENMHEDIYLGVRAFFKEQVEFLTSTRPSKA